MTDIGAHGSKVLLPMLIGPVPWPDSMLELGSGHPGSTKGTASQRNG